MRRPELRRICKDVRKLQHRKPQLATLRALSIGALGVAGSGAAGLLNYYGVGESSRPHVWVAILWWIALGAGLVGALILALWKTSEESAFNMEIDRIAEDIETLDY